MPFRPSQLYSAKNLAQGVPANLDEFPNGSGLSQHNPTPNERTPSAQSSTTRRR